MPTMKQYQMVGDANSNQHGVVLLYPEYVNAYVLAANTAESATVPTGAKVAVFSSTNNFYADFQGGTAAVPAADVTDGSAPELNPVARGVKGVTTISLIAPAETIITISYWT